MSTVKNDGETVFMNDHSHMLFVELKGAFWRERKRRCE